MSTNKTIMTLEPTLRASAKSVDVHIYVIEEDGNGGLFQFEVSMGQGGKLHIRLHGGEWSNEYHAFRRKELFKAEVDPITCAPSSDGKVVPMP